MTDTINEEKARMAEYPEHEKLKKVSEESQKVGAFLDWLMNEQGVTLAMWHSHDDSCRCTHEFHYNSDKWEFTKQCPECSSWWPGTIRLPVCHLAESYPNPLHRKVEDWLALYFEIDRDAIEQEKRAMLEELRRQNAAA